MKFGRTKSVCPVCLKVLDARMRAEADGIYMDKTCPEHGDYVVRIRFERDPDGSLKVCRLVYDQSSALAENFDSEIAKKAKKRPRRRRRRAKAEL